MAINILDSTIANRISAGEVVERPSSVVKELVDNAIDAGASEISVEIFNGGIDKIIVTDNGSGIEESDIKIAFLPHATSKIKDISDLDSIFTLGFRGEALASIVSVSQVNMTTKTHSDDLATSIEVNGGEFVKEDKIAGICGTKMEVKNLFYNTPARRKFLRKPKQEENEITNLITRYILSKPNIKFKYCVDNTLVYKNSGKSLMDAISCVYGVETTANILPIEIRDGNIHIYGFVSKISFTKPNTTYQTLLVNGRYVIDELVSKAVYLAYEEYLMSRQFPFFVLNIDMPFTDVDVNVHPNKLSIRFSSPSKIFDLVNMAVRHSIIKSLKVKDEEKLEELVLPEIQQEVTIDSVIYDTPQFDDNQITFRQSFGNNISMFDTNNRETNPIVNKLDNEFNKQEKVNSLDSDINFIKQQSKEIRHQTEFSNLSDNSTNQEISESYTPIQDLSDYKIIGEIFNEFLILEHRDKMLLLDFHAGHERLLYDELKEKLKAKKIAIQDLLFPYTEKLTPKEIDFILSMQEDLAKLGFGIDQSSFDEIRIFAVPVLFKDINLKNFLSDILHDFNNLRPKVNYELDSYLMQTACKSAVKAGQKLSQMQIEQLLKRLDKDKPVLLCPHGRPIISVVNRAQIERWFKRIV